MLINFLTVAGQVLTLYLLMSIGFTLKKLKRLNKETLSQMTLLLLYVVTPCLVIDAMQIERTADNARAMGYSLFGSAAFFAVGIILHRFFFRKQPPDTRDVLRFGSIYTNSGFMGIPLVRAVLGETAMVYAVVFLVIMALVHWTHGAKLMDKDGRISLRDAFLNPGTLGFLAGTVMFALNLRLPWPVGNALVFVSNLNTPLAMIVIGAQMADADLPKLFRIKELYVSAGLKLVLFPLITATALYSLNLPPLVYCAVVILSATPTAGVTGMFAQRFNRDTATAARCVSFSTLLSVLTLPLFAAAARALVGL